MKGKCVVLTPEGKTVFRGSMRECKEYVREAIRQSDDDYLRIVQAENARAAG